MTSDIIKFGSSIVIYTTGGMPRSTRGPRLKERWDWERRANAYGNFLRGVFLKCVVLWPIMKENELPKKSQDIYIFKIYNYAYQSQGFELWGLGSFLPWLFPGLPIMFHKVCLQVSLVR